MRRIFSASLLVAFAAWATACASHTQVPADDRAALERELSGRDSQKFLKLSYFVTPFFGDGSKRLLTHVPPDEVRLLNHPDGTPVNPGAVEKILPAGTPVKITKVEFPTSWIVTERVPYTPRTQPWVYLEAADQPRALPFVLVLRQGIDTREQFVTELSRWLSDTDPRAMIEGWTEPVREAVRTKTAVTDMPADALEMAWGYPERIKRELEGDKWKETWVYPGKKRVAYLLDGKVVRTESK